MIVFTRYPVAGEVKTRLIPLLGPEGAAHLHEQMTRRMLAWGRLLRERASLDLEVACTGAEEAEMRAWLGDDLLYTLQKGPDLGARMDHALSRALEAGAPKAILVGTDLPQVDDNLLEDALNALEQADLVLGPAMDGGYYLVGLKSPQPGLFQDIPWGTDSVLDATLKKAGSLGLKTQLVARLSDVDEPQDLPIWEGALIPPIPGRISVIIPCLNEADHLKEAVASAAGESDIEVLVVDGGSSDGTPELAQELGLITLSSSPGRGVQMARGAQQASGEYLVFLHADTRLSPGWDQEVKVILNEPGISIGAFTFKLDQDSWGLRLIERMVAWRSGSRQLPYGDQALFIRASLLRRLGGFPELPLMEDVELVRRARTRGQVGISELYALSSARRWQELGALNNTLRNWSCFVAYSLGVPPERLCSWYYGGPRRG